MAPKAGTKRGRPCKEAPHGKAQRTEKAPKSDPRLDGIFDAVKTACLPEQCKALLMAIIPSTFSVQANERHAVQEHVVGMIGRMIEGSRAKMTKGIEEEKTVMAAADAKTENLAGTAREVESRLSKAVALSDEKSQLLEIAKKVVQEKLELLESAKSKQAEEEKILAALQKEKEQFEVEFTFLLESEERDETQVKVRYAAMEPLIAKLTLDESLLAALFTSCGKAPSARTEFDKMVADQLQSRVNEKVAKLGEEVEATTRTKNEKAEVTEAAQGEVKQAEAAQTSAESELQATKDCVAAVRTELSSAQEAIKAFEIEHRQATKSLDAKVAALQQFEDWNVECFTALKNTSVIEKEKELEVEEAKPVPVEHLGA